MMKILSICCGAGGIDEGLKQAGFETTLAVDFNPINQNFSKDALETIKLNHPNTETLHENILNIEESLGKFDIVVGGPPCPEFSIAKQNRNYDDTLVKCFWKIVKNTGAKYWLMENVPGVIKVCTFRNFLVNCVDYGTPQKRIRRFFTNLSEPVRSHMERPFFAMDGIKKEKWISVREALGLDGVLIDNKFGHYIRKSGVNSTDKPSKTIDTQPQELFIQDRKTTFGEGFRYYSVNQPSHTLLSASQDYFVTKNYKFYSLKYLKEKNEVWWKSHQPNPLNKPISTILAKDRCNANEIITDGQYARKLTNKECAILQGFPKDYKFFGTKTSVKKQIGNALPPQPVKALFQQLN